MPAKAGLSQQLVVSAALAIVDESGLESLTLARVAQRTGVATPSLYKHVAGLTALRRLVQLRVLAEIDEAARAAVLGRAGAAAVRAFALAYRDYLRSYPHRHPLMESVATDPEIQAAALRVAQVGFAAVSGFGLTGSAAVHAIRCLRSAVHGFTRLEAIGGFGLPEDVDETFDHLLEMITAGMMALAKTP